MRIHNNKEIAVGSRAFSVSAGLGLQPGAAPRQGGFGRSPAPRRGCRIHPMGPPALAGPAPWACRGADRCKRAYMLGGSPGRKRRWQGHCVCGLRIAGQLSLCVRDCSVPLCRPLAVGSLGLSWPRRRGVSGSAGVPCGRATGWRAGRSCHLHPLAATGSHSPEWALTPSCASEAGTQGAIALSLLQVTIGQENEKGLLHPMRLPGRASCRGRLCRGRSSGAWFTSHGAGGGSQGRGAGEAGF